MSFATLPLELLQRILVYAAQPPYGSRGQAPTLALISRVSYSIVTELLYKHVRVTNVPMLRRIHASLETNSALGDLVQSIHIGPEDGITYGGWPLLLEGDPWADEDFELLFQTTLPKSLLPRSVSPGSAFSFDEDQKMTCQHSAIALALRAAQDAVDVDPYDRGVQSSQPSRRIGIRAWASRLWEIQAALDLFLMAMRRWEDEGRCDEDQGALQSQSTTDSPASSHSGECSKGTCGHYPLLKLEARSASVLSKPSLPAQKYLSLSQEDLWHHLGRQGSPAEHFEHLLLLARSDPSTLDMGKRESRKVKRELSGPHIELWEDGNTDDEDVTSVSSDEADWNEPRPIISSTSQVSKCEELLKLANGVLVRIPRATNLSLAGFFFRSLGSFLTLDRLCSLTLGPFTQWWNHVLLPLSISYSPKNVVSQGSADSDLMLEVDCEGKEGSAIMSSLAVLRICGMISTADAKKIATQLPSLKDLRLELIGTDWQNLNDILDALRGQSAQPTATLDQPARFTEVRLGPAALRSDWNPLVDAWREKRYVEGTLHPLKIMVSENVVAKFPEPLAMETDCDKTLSAQYAEAKSWWEQGRVGLGLHSRLE